MADNFSGIVGGRLFITWSGGISDNGSNRRLEATGTMRMRSTGVKRDAKVTASGKLVLTYEATPKVWETDLYVIEGNDPMELWQANVRVNITVNEIDTGRYHRFTNGVVWGEPEYDPTNGVITGMKFAADFYTGQAGGFPLNIGPQ